MTDIQADIQALEAFILDDEALTTVEIHANQFNVFIALGLVHYEIRHSAFLAWLLDPYQTHGLDDAFLKIFIKQVFAVVDGDRLGGRDVFQLDGLSLDTAKVHREWRNIDLLVVDDRNQLVIVIENKIWSTESRHQLEKYRKIVEEVYPSPAYAHIFLLLSPDARSPEHSDHYHPVGYDVIDASLTKLLAVKGHQLTAGPKRLIQQYLHTLREDIMDNSHLKQIVAEIYNNHKLAIDTIIQHLPDLYDQYSIWMYEVLQEMQSSDGVLIIGGRNKSYQKLWFKDVDFVPKLSQGWNEFGEILVCEFQNRGKTLTLDVVMGPGDQELRQYLHNAMKTSNAIAISRKSYAKEWKRFRVDKFFDYSAIEELTESEFKEKFKRRLKRFMNTDFSPIRKVLLDHRAEIEAYGTSDT